MGEREIEIYNSTYETEEDQNVKLFLGDCFDKINAVDENSVDLILTDPPYWHKKKPWEALFRKEAVKHKKPFCNIGII